MRTSIALLILLTTVGAWAAEEPLMFKDLALGSSLSELRAHYEKVECPTDKTCFATSPDPKKPLTVGGVGVLSIMFSFYEGRIELIAMRPPSEHFDAIATGLRGRYGTQKDELSSPVLTKAGVEHQNTVLLWEQPGGVIIFRRYSSDIAQSSLIYQTHALVSRQKRAIEERKNRALKDF